jgi:superfamily I DNA/RNA helicase
MYKKLILGSPGTGKTTRLISIAKECLKNTPEYRIAFFSFTKKAVNEAAERAREALGITQFRNFRTLHSLCYRELGLTTYRVINYYHLKKIEQLTGLRITRKNAEDEELTEKGDKLSFLESYARSVKKPLKEVWEKGFYDVTWADLKFFSDIYSEYKTQNKILDFTDMLNDYIKLNKPLPIHIAFIDEAQDLSPLQWDVVELATKNAKRIYYAGDDDQAIYKWSGADVDKFLSLQVTEKEVLKTTYRLPPEIYNLSLNISSKIKQRYEKSWNPVKEKGEIHYHTSIEKLTFEDDWLILARSNYQLVDIVTFLRENGYYYSVKGKSSVDETHLELIYGYIKKQKNQEVKKSILDMINPLYSDKLQWYDALINIPEIDRDYYRTLLRRGVKLSEKPKITVSTIHGSKGGEATNVLLITDISERVNEEFDKDPDNEHRVFYVGVTRAKQALHIVMPETETYYSLQ